MNIFKLISLSIVIVFLHGCATAAQPSNMTYTNPLGFTYDKQLKNNIEVSSVAGGEKTNPLWKSEIGEEDFEKAIKSSLSSQGLLSEKGRYKLTVILAHVSTPSPGANFTVTTKVHYFLVDANTNKVILNDLITASYTATLGDTLIGVKRLRLANEGSARNNIERFLQKLSALHIGAGEISVPD